jgi:hypothetical protein
LREAAVLAPASAFLRGLACVSFSTIKGGSESRV